MSKTAYLEGSGECDTRRVMNCMHPNYRPRHRQLQHTPKHMKPAFVDVATFSCYETCKMAVSVPPRRFNAQVNPGTCLLLYVDDDSMNQTVIATMLASKREIRVLVADDQEDIEDIMNEEPHLPDVVIMDNQLANCTGGDVIAWMRETYSDEITFVLCTGRSRTEASALADDVQAKGYLCKPYTEKDILQILSSLNLP